MYLIPDDAALRRYIPNVMATLPGDRTLFERLEPHLVTSQQWLESSMIDRGLLAELVEMAQSADEPLYHLPRMATALRAWRSAIPSLDIVVTANGLAAVETKTTKPASASKINRLMTSLSSDLDRILLLLLGELEKLPAWHETKQGRGFGGTLFSSPEDVGMLVGRYGDLFTAIDAVNDTVIDRYNTGIAQVKGLEDAIAEKWLSHRVMKRLRDQLMRSRMEEYRPCPDGLRSSGCHRGIDEMVKRVTDLVKRGVMRMLRDGDGSKSSWPVGGGEIPGTHYPEIEEAVTIVASKGDVWPEFKGTRQAERLRLRGYENNKEARGYFF